MKEITAYRDPPLSPDEFIQLDQKAKRLLSFKERMVREIFWETDEYGDRIQKSRMVPCGPEVFAKGELDERMIKSLQYPAPAKSVIVHLTRLRAHKPYATGEDAWKIILTDLCKDLHGCSEYAITKTCEFFRQDTSLRYFPDTALLQRRIKDLDFSIRALAEAKPAPKETQIEQQPIPKPTDEGKRRVAEIMHNGGFHASKPDREYCGKCQDEK